jgi:hypothetical protein
MYRGEPIAEIKYHGGPSNILIWDHPHAGARDADGYWNYVPDVTFIRRKVLHKLGSEDSSTYFPLEPGTRYQYSLNTQLTRGGLFSKQLRQQTTTRSCNATQER